MLEIAGLENSELIEIVEKTVLGLRQNREGAMREVNLLMKQLLRVLSELVQYLEQQENMEEINQIVIERLQNLNIAYSRKDRVLLADVLQYEIMELLYFSIEVTEDGDGLC